MRPRAPRQLELGSSTPATHGGARKGAGRPRRSAETVPHARRPEVDPRHPLHVTLRVARGVWNLRSQRAFVHVERALREEQHRGLRIVHYSVQGNHLHLLVESPDRTTMSRRLQGFTIRLARALNGMMKRRGRVLAERYHARALRTPTEVRNAIRYVLTNHVKHAAQAGRTGMLVDPFSSGPFFAYWSPSTRRTSSSACTRPPPMSEPETYLLKTGWRRVSATLP